MAPTFEALPNELKAMIAGCVKSMDDEYCENTLLNLRLVSRDMCQNSDIEFKKHFETRTVFFHPRSIRQLIEISGHAHLRECVHDISFTIDQFSAYDTTEVIRRGTDAETVAESELWCELFHEQARMHTSGCAQHLLVKALRRLPNAKSIVVSDEESLSKHSRLHRATRFPPRRSNDTVFIWHLFSTVLAALSHAHVRPHSFIAHLERNKTNQPCLETRMLSPYSTDFRQLATTFNQLFALHLTIDSTFAQSEDAQNTSPTQSLCDFFQTMPELGSLSLYFDNIYYRGENTYDEPLRYTLKHLNLSKLQKLKLKFVRTPVEELGDFLKRHSSSLEHLKLSSICLKSHDEWASLLEVIRDNLNLKTLTISLPEIDIFNDSGLQDMIPLQKFVLTGDIRFQLDKAVAKLRAVDEEEKEIEYQEVEVQIAGDANAGAVLEEYQDEDIQNGGRQEENREHAQVQMIEPWRGMLLFVETISKDVKEYASILGIS
jgi:hypothetical protein